MGDVSFCPICFVFSPGTISKKTKRVYPFDTGAAVRGLYEPAIKRGHARPNYSVLAVIESARRIVKGYFETDENYLSNKPKIGLTFSSTEVDAEAY